MVSYDTGASKAEVYVLIPTLSYTVDTVIYIWGNKGTSQTQPSVTDTYGRNAVWTKYKMVLHGENATDSTGRLTLSEFGSPTYSTTNAKLGKGITLNGSSYLYDSTAYIMQLTAGSALYYESWVYTTSIAYANMFSLGYDGNQGSQMNDVFYQQVINALKPTSLIKNDAWIACTNAITTSTLTHIVGCFDGSSAISFLKNGASNGTPAETPTSGTHLDRGFFVGCYGGSGNDSYARSQFYTGVLDELRVSMTNLGVGWGTTSYNNQNSPSTFGTTASPVTVNSERSAKITGTTTMSVIPAGVTIIWTGTNASIPTGWTRVTALDGRYVKGASNGNGAGGTGGTATHTHTGSAHTHTMNTHTHSLTFGASPNTGLSQSGYSESTTSHTTHTALTSGARVGGSLTSASTYASLANDPPYVEVIFIQSNGTPQGIPAEAVVFTADTNFVNNTGQYAGWYLCDGTNSTTNLTDKYLRGATTNGNAGATGGSLTNVHSVTHDTSTVSHSHTGGTSTQGGNQNSSSTGANDSAIYSHTHTITVVDGNTTANSASITGTEVVEPVHARLFAIQNKSGIIKNITTGIGLWNSSIATIPFNATIKTGMYDKHIKVASSTGGLLEQTWSASGANDNAFRYDTGSTEVAQGFMPLYSGSITSVSLYGKKVGSPTGNMWVQIQTDSSGKPSNSSLGQSANVDVSAFPTSNGWLTTFTFSSPVSVTGGTQYHIVAMGDFAISSTNYMTLYSTNSDVYKRGYYNYRYNAAWTSLTARNLYFREYILPLSATGGSNSHAHAGVSHTHTTTAHTHTVNGGGHTSAVLGNGTKTQAVTAGSDSHTMASSSVTAVYASVSGSADSSSSEPPYTTAIFVNFLTQTITNSERSAKIAGILVGNDSRSAKITGVGITNSNRNAKIHGKYTSLDGKDAKIQGLGLTSSEKGAKIQGYLTADTSRDAKIAGMLGDLEERDAKIHGLAVISDIRSAKVAGEGLGNSERGAVIHGIASIDSSRNAKITGQWGIIIPFAGTNASIPTGWERATDFDDKFVKGASNGAESGSTGGSATHSHASTASHSHTIGSHVHSITIPNSNKTYRLEGGEAGNNAAGYGHNHGSAFDTGTVDSQTVGNATPNYSSVSNNPPYKEVIYIKSHGGTGIPDNGIVFCDDKDFVNNSGFWAGWYLADGNNGTTNYSGKYPKGAVGSGDAGGTGGSTQNIHGIDHTHTVSHTHSATNSDYSIREANYTGSTGNTVSYHNHSVTVNSNSTGIPTETINLTTNETVEPAYTKLLVIQNKSGTTKKYALHMVTMWGGSLASIPAEFSLNNGSNTTVDMRDRHLKLTTTPSEVGNTGGSNTHSHSAQSHAHSAVGHSHVVPDLTHTSNSKNPKGNGIYEDDYRNYHPSFNTGSTNYTVSTSETTAGDSQSNEPQYTTTLFITYTLVLSANDTRSARIKGIFTANDAKNAKVHGIDTSFTERIAKIYGVIFAGDNRFAKIFGKIFTFDARKAKIHGIDTKEDSRQVKMMGCMLANDERQAKILAVVHVVSDRSAKVTGVVHYDDLYTDQGTAYTDLYHDQGTTYTDEYSNHGDIWVNWY